MHNKASNLSTKLELGVLPIHVKIYRLATKYYCRMNNLIKSNDTHNVLLRNAYLEDKQLCIENKKCWLSCIKSLQRLLNVIFDTEYKMLGSRLEKFFEDKFLTELQLQQNKVQCGKLSFFSTLFNYDIKKLEIQPYLCLPLLKNLVFFLLN